MKKIALSDLIDVKEQNEINPVLLYNKQELLENNESEVAKNNYFDLKPVTNLETDIYNILSSEKNLLRKKARENMILAQFDSKMHRIKNIKSKTYRRIKRQEKIKSMILDSDEKENTEQVTDVESNLVPADMLEKYESNNKETKNVFEFGNDKSKEKQESQAEMVKSIFKADNEFVEEFNAQKEVNINAELPNDTKDVLPGWGVWGGTDLEVVETKYNTFITFNDGTEKEERKDYKLNHVIINENTAKLDDKYIAAIPYGYTSEDYKMKMETPIEKKWVNQKMHKNEKRGNTETKKMRNNKQ